MTWEIADEDFDDRWRALESPYRRRIASLGHSGKAPEDPAEAALVLAFARRRLHPLELWGPVVAGVVAYMAITQLFLGGAEALPVALVIIGLTTFSLFRRGKLESAVLKNEEVVASAPPPQVESADQPEGEEPNPVE
ncbi:MAG: hypothetical protein GEU71_09440 [Actinobacteria bacterium]|jgi:hypothetical protein|nr:hypothetical protein [Actinomycetota bacterium]